MAPKMHPKFTKHLSLGPAPAKWGTKVVIFRVQVPFMCPPEAQIDEECTKHLPQRQTNKSTDQQIKL